MKYFVFSDVHGFYNELKNALDKAGFDENNPEHMLISCGDNFDRGNQNVKVFEFLKKMYNKNKIILIRGNHEDLLIECLKRGVAYYHDVSNGTFNSILQFGSLVFPQKNAYEMLETDFDVLCTCIHNDTDLVSFINNHFIDYFETKKFVFTHGFIPLKVKDGVDASLYTTKTIPLEYNPNWREASMKEWNNARWLNGMEEVVLKRNRVPDKTIVVGHFHASYGNVRQKYGWDINKNIAYQHEFHDDSEDFFRPFVAPGIVAIDACTAYTHKVNVYVIEDEPLGK